VDNKEITIVARANVEGHLYGSVGPAQIAAALAQENLLVEPEHIVLDDPIKQLDKYDVVIRFAEDVTATIHVWIVPEHEEGAPPATSEPAAATPQGDPPAAPKK
jgi:large subunit ribosomal protein L9